MPTNSFNMTLINQEVFKIRLADELNKGIRESAEPILTKALEDIEKEMRKKLASMIVSFIDGYVEIETMNNALKIVVRHDYSH